MGTSKNDDGHPDQLNAEGLAARGLQVVDGHGKPIERVIDADRGAGKVTRYAVEDGNLLREGDRFKVVEEERVVRFAPIAPVTPEQIMDIGDAEQPGTGEQAA